MYASATVAVQAWECFAYLERAKPMHDSLKSWPFAFDFCLATDFWCCRGGVSPKLHSELAQSHVQWRHVASLRSQEHLPEYVLLRTLAFRESLG